MAGPRVIVPSLASGPTVVNVAPLSSVKLPELVARFAIAPNDAPGRRA